jgi:thioredoxin reductase (NADPH)
VLSDPEKRETLRLDALFALIGAQPRTEWLAEAVERDEHGFICTSAEVPRTRTPGAFVPGRLETSMPGVFAVGDVRSGSVKRVASAVGEGAVAVQYVHEYLAAPRAASERTPAAAR